MTQGNTDRQTVEVVYLGRSPGVGAKWVDRYMLVDEFTALGADDRRKASPNCYRADKRSRVIGGVYKVEGTVEDGKLTAIWTGSLSFVRRLEDHPLVGIFEAEHYAAEIRGKVEAREKQFLANPKLQGDIANLRAVYDRLGWSDRAVFETVLLSLLRRP